MLLDPSVLVEGMFLKSPIKSNRKAIKRHPSFRVKAKKPKEGRTGVSFQGREVCSYSGAPQCSISIAGSCDCHDPKLSSETW